MSNTARMVPGVIETRMSLPIPLEIGRERFNNAVPYPIKADNGGHAMVKLWRPLFLTGPIWAS